MMICTFLQSCTYISSYIYSFSGIADNFQFKISIERTIDLQSAVDWKIKQELKKFIDLKQRTF